MHKSVRPNDKPEWLLNVQLAVDRLAGVMTLQGDDRDYRNLKAFIDAEIECSAREAISAPGGWRRNCARTTGAR